MHLFYFNPNTYDLQYFVMAESTESAFQAVLDHLKDRSKNNESYKTFYKEEYEIWTKCSIDNLPSKYTIEIRSENEVIQSEIS